MIDFQGGSALRLTDSPASDQYPKWFPDSSQIAFVSTRQGQPGIWSVPRLGGTARLVVDNAEDPSISPDGRRIAFVRLGPTGYFRVHVAPISEPAEATVVTGDADGLWDHRRPAWSPDGRWICYGAARDLWLVSVNDGKPRRLTTNDEVDFDPEWSHDGRYVVLFFLPAGHARPVARGAGWRITGASDGRQRTGAAPQHFSRWRAARVYDVRRRSRCHRPRSEPWR